MPTSLVPAKAGFDLSAELVSGTIGLETGGTVHIVAEHHTDLHNVVVSLFSRVWFVSDEDLQPVGYEWPDALANAAHYAQAVNAGTAPSAIDPDTVNAG